MHIWTNLAWAQFQWWWRLWQISLPSAASTHLVWLAPPHLSALIFNAKVLQPVHIIRMDCKWLQYLLLNNIITPAHVHYVAVPAQDARYSFSSFFWQLLLLTLQDVKNLPQAWCWWTHGLLETGQFGILWVFSIMFFPSLSGVDSEKNQYLKRTTKCLLLHDTDTV